MRWLRTCYSLSGGNCFLRGLRSDGQLFVAWNSEPETPAGLRIRLDGMINDPQLPPVIDEETGEATSVLVDTACYKGHPDWVEEE